MNTHWFEFDELLPPHDWNVLVLFESGPKIARLKEVGFDGEVTVLDTNNVEWRHTLVAWMWLPEGYDIPVPSKETDG